VTDSQNGAFSFTDTLGRTLISSSGFGSTGNTVTVAGLPAYTLTWGTASTNFSVSYVQEGSDSSCYGMKGDNETLPVITAIALPNGQEYQFQYESTYGQVDKIVYPNGGYVRYVWGLNSLSAFGLFGDNGTVPNPQGCGYQYDFPAVTDRYVSFDGSTEVQHQHFSYSTNWASGGATWTSKTTTVTTSDLLRNESFQTAYTYASVPAPAPPNVYDYFVAQLPVESTVSYDDWGGSNIRTTTKTWVDQFEMQGEQTQNNGTVVSDLFFVFGYQGQITNKYECGSGQTCYSATQSSPPSAYARHTNITYYSSIPDRPLSVITYDGSGTKAAETDYSYDCCSLTATSGVVNHDYTNYSASQYANRGNATSVSKWVNTSGGSLTWNYAYDDTGQALSMKDPQTNTTTYSYADSFAGCGSAGGSTNAYLTKITDAKGFTQSFTYRYCDGQLNSATDRNNQTTSYSYSDSLNRLSQISYPDTGKTTYAYTSICGKPTTTTMLLTGTSNYTETATPDGICHMTETALTSDPVGTDYTATAFDGEGRVWTVSNPYRSTGDPTYGLTTDTYDALGRTTSVGYPDGSTATTSYSGLSSTVTDPAGKTRTLTNDNLGRLASVNEAGSYTTTYTYYATNDLNTVTQGSQVRTFVYDSVSRLTSATNPESGLTSYTYPTSSGSGICSGDPTLPCTREDARSITTTYAYDALNRTISKSYSDGTTPTATLSYDEATVILGSWASPTLAYPKGRLTHTTTKSGSTILTATVQDFDPMGRTQHYWQCTPANCGSSSIWAVVYGYDAAGDVTSWSHPAGYTISQSVNGAREVTQVTSSLSDSMHPPVLAQNITYTPFGGLSSLQNGCEGTGCTNTQETYSYNNRLQASEIQLGTSGNAGADYSLAYNYSLPGGTTPPGCPVQAQGSGNNGSVIGYTYSDSVNPSYSNSALFVYDSVNRLACAQATGDSTYNLAFSYTQDGSTGQFGNMTCSLISQTNGPCPQYTFNAANNQITGYTYDGAGDMISGGGHTYQYDAEARLVSVDGGTTESYVYNALGQQVRLIAPNFSYTWDHLYDPAGQWMGRWSNNAWWASGIFHLDGRLFAVYFDQTYFIHVNNLGSTVMTTTAQGAVNGDTQLYPWGQDWLGGTPEWHFAAFQYGDSATGLYPTLNRQYANGEGRWLTPDPGGEKVVHLDDPQTWNMYAYVGNNPTTLTDSTGLECDHSQLSETCNADVGSGRDYQAQNQSAADKPAPQPAPTDPNGKPTAPPVPVPGAPEGTGWKWNPDPQNPRGGTWGPDNWKGPNPPRGSWDPDGHWDVDKGDKSPRDHYDPKGNPITPGTAHPGNAPTTMMDRMKSITPGPILKWGTAGVVIYIIIDEGSRLYPPRNLVPVP
jgi:RHS repeat-associated protein